MKNQSINDLYTSFLSGEISRSHLEGSVYSYLVNNQEKTCLCHWKRDEYEDYLSWFYPRLHKAIDSYTEVGSSFEAFVTRFLWLSSKEFKVRITTNSITEYSTWSARVPDMYVQEEIPAYLPDNTDSIINDLLVDSKGRKNYKRILALIIKCYYYISDDFADKIALKTGIDREELAQMLNKIREVRQERDDEIYHLKERIYSQYFRCIAYEKRISMLKKNSNMYLKLNHRLEKAKLRLENMRKRFNTIRTDATNQQVAEIIGTTKNNVDANLHRLKRRWKKLAKKANEN